MNGTLPRRVTTRPLKGRRYAHFDDPLPQAVLDTFAIDGDDVARHSFLPLVGYQKLTRKMDFSVFPPLPKNKERDIRYASHKDSAIYSVYAQALSATYEATISTRGVGDCILAYRGGIGYNVPFAKSLINEVRSRGHCIVVCLDVSGFFDSLQHKHLKRMLSNVLGVPRLPADWYKIFERLTCYEYALREDIEKKLGKPKKLRICDITTFRKVVRPLLKSNPNDFGIPQGTPLSGLLANIYMFDFDCAANSTLKAVGGSYRRYSDDIAIVIPAGKDDAEIIDWIETQLKSIGLMINTSKTCRTEFIPSPTGQSYIGDELQYLGFTYDGKSIRIRPASIKNFYGKMKGNIRRYVRSAAARKIPLSTLRKRVLIGRFTHWGDSRNFVQYAYRASRELGSPEIKRQMRNHVGIFDRQWSKMVDKYGP